MRTVLIKLPFVAALAVGVGLIVVTLAFSRFDAADAADEVVNGAAPLVTQASVERIRDDLDRITGTAGAISGPGLDRLGAISGEGRRALVARVEERDPRFTENLGALPMIGQLAEKVVGNLERRLGEFDSAESLPGLGMTLESATWAQLVLALGLVVLGIVGLLRPRRLLAGVVLAIGALLVAVPLALSYPEKTADTDAVLDSLRPFTVEKVKAREDGLATVRSVFDDFRGEVIPLVARRTGASVEEVEAALGRTSPDLSPESFRQVDAALDRFEGLVAFSRRIQPRLVEADTMSATAGMWVTLGSGAVLLLFGAIGAFAGRSRQAG